MGKENAWFHLDNNAFTYSNAFFDEVRSVPLHIQDYGYEIFLFLGGNAVFSVDGNIYELNPYDILIMNMRELHAPIFKDKTPYARKCMVFSPSFMSGFITSEFNPFRIFEARGRGTHNKIEAKLVREHELDKAFMDIETCLTDNKPGSEMMVKAYLAIMLVKMNRIMVFSSASRPQNERIGEIIKYIDENLDADLSHKALSEKLFINKSYLYHLFKNETGFSINQYISHRRIIKAKELMIAGASSTEVAILTGFGDYSNFYRTFKRLTGNSPKAFLEKTIEK